MPMNEARLSAARLPKKTEKKFWYFMDRSRVAIWVLSPISEIAIRLKAAMSPARADGLIPASSPKKQEQAEQDEHPGRYASDDLGSKERSQPFSQDRRAAREERESQERAEQDRPPSVAESQGENHELCLVPELGDEDQAEGDEKYRQERH